MNKLGDVERKILDAAETLFAEKGFDATSIRDIITTADVNIASVHYYFNDKEHLYIETVKHAHTCTMSHDGFTLPVLTLTPIEKLTVYIREMVRGMHAPASPISMKLLMREMAAPGKAAHIVVREFIQPLAFALRDILRELLPNFDEAKLLMVGFSIIGQILYYRQNRPVSELIFGKEHIDALSADMVTEHVTQFTFAALGLAAPIIANASGRASAANGNSEVASTGPAPVTEVRA